MKRLLQDTHFALDDRLDEEVKHILRVNHADRMYDASARSGTNAGVGTCRGARTVE